MVIGTPTVLNLIPGGVMKIIHVNQVNENIEIQFRIMNGAQPFNVPEGVSCTIRGTKGDNFGYAAAVAVTAGSNVVTVTLTEQLTAVAGTGNVFELVFVGSADDMKVSTENFKLAVERAALGEDTVISDSDLAYADQVLDQLQSVGAVNAQVQQNKANIAAEITRATAAEQTLQQNINAEASTRAATDQNLQAQISQIVAPSGEAPSAAEVQNARVGADGVTYHTLGEAIRANDSQLKSHLDYKANNKYGGNESSFYITLTNEKGWNVTDGNLYTNSYRAASAQIEKTPDMATITCANGYSMVLMANNDGAGHALNMIRDWGASVDLESIEYKYIFISIKKADGTAFDAGATTDVISITKYVDIIPYLTQGDLSGIEQDVRACYQTFYQTIGAEELAKNGTALDGDIWAADNYALSAEGLAVTNATGYKVKRYAVESGALVYIKASLDYSGGVVVQFQSNKTIPIDQSMYNTYVISSVKTSVDDLLIIPDNCTWVLISMASNNSTDTVVLIGDNVMESISAKLDGRFTQDSPTSNTSIALTAGKTFYALNGTFVNDPNRAVSGILQATNTDISIQVTSGYKMWVYGNNTGSGEFFSQLTDWAETMSFSDLDYAFYVVVVKRNDGDVITSDDLTNVLTVTYASGFAPYLSESEIIELCKETQWKGKKIVWFGTSIPAGSGSLKYPNLLGQRLGATVHNEAVGSSMIRAGFADKATAEDPLGILDGTSRYNMLYSLSQTVAEKTNIIDNWAENKSKFISDQYSTVPDTITAEERAKIISCSYENKVDKYLSTGSIGVCDLYVFDHGVNESWRTEDLSELPASGVDERLYTVGAFDFIIRRILANNPKANIIILTNYENQYRTGVCEMQELVASRWAIPCIKIYDKFGWSQQIVNGNTMLDNALPDGLHPFSDTTGKATYKYVDVLYNEFKKLSAYW